jgi:hypothetical protein
VSGSQKISERDPNFCSKYRWPYKNCRLKDSELEILASISTLPREACSALSWGGWHGLPSLQPRRLSGNCTHAPCATEDDEAPGRYSLPHPREELGVIALEPIELRGLSDHKLVVGILGEVRELARP